MKTPSLQDIEQATRDIGFEQLRPGQREAIEAVLKCRDTLAVLPTGAGKSAIYRIASRLLPGTTVVVSPLLALQRDQVESINGDDGHDAALLNSTLKTQQRRETLEHFVEGEHEFLFLAPEQLAKPETLETLQAAHVSLFVVDEAHCVAEWGHDFRPDYLKLGAVIEALEHPRVLALTATAAPLVRQDIATQLRMENPCVVVRGFDRPNIFFGVQRFEDDETKTHALLEAVHSAIANDLKPGIIYCATRKAVEEVTQELLQKDVRAVSYHAGLRKDEREAAQTAFMSDEADVVVATNAFGMGVDKPDVRWVYHHAIPDSLDSYAQESGRAGRNGEAAHAVLFYCPADLGVQRFHSGGGSIQTEDVQSVAHVLLQNDGEISENELRDETDLSRAKVGRVLESLQQTGAVEIEADGQVVVTDGVLDTRKAARVARAAVERQRNFDRSRIEMMQQYAETQSCRREFVLNYFGETLPEANAHCCDNCERETSVENDIEYSNQGADEEELPFPIGARVSHNSLGEGQVMRYEEDKIVVLFDEAGYKTLGMALVLENNLLSREPNGL